MSVIQISTPFNIDLEFEIADFYKRIFAYLMDFMLIRIIILNALPAMRVGGLM